MTKNVSVILPIKIKEKWQEHMTECCIRTMMDTTDMPFELVIAESESSCYEDSGYSYIHFPKSLGYSKEFNQALSRVTGDYIVHIGNDIFTRPGWLEAMMKCFEIPDCGAATLASSDMKHNPASRIMEGIYCPLMMLRREDFRFDEDTFPDVFNDSDMIMQMYESGKRMYRNWNVVIVHLGQQTYKMSDPKKRELEFNAAKERFVKKHGNSKLLIYRAFTEGWVI